MNQFILLTITLVSLACPGQNLTIRQRGNLSEKYATEEMMHAKRQNVRIVFYNVENLYDPFDDTTKLDDEFTSSGARHWGYSKFTEKVNHVAKTFLAIGESDPPAIIGMCEVENKYVLNRLVCHSPLQRFGYRVIHHESPDVRGVDVALIYRPEKFTVISWKCYEVHYSFDTLSKTRDLLLVKGILFRSDTITFIINHWPSRRGGQKESQPRRNFVASLVRSICDSVSSLNPETPIVLMGDLNDEPDNESLTHFLMTKMDTNRIKPADLVNLMLPQMKRWNQGTIKYQGRWSIFDQFIVTGNLIKGSCGLISSFGDAHIFRSDFLTSKDEKNFGVKLNRSFTGPRYTRGFSDHLPVYLDIWKR
jgi:hypothetical protein